MNRQLVIIGASGNGKVAADVAVKMGIYEKIIFLDDDISLSNCMQFTVVGKCEEANKYMHEYDFFVAIGNTEIRQRVLSQLELEGATIATLIHPNSVLAQNVKIGSGTIVMAGAVVNPDSVIGKGCIINTCASVDHDCLIEDYVHIAVGAHVAGTVNIGTKTWIGAGATISNNISICSDCTIGAGAVVVKDILETGTYVGVPAKELIVER